MARAVAEETVYGLNPDEIEACLRSKDAFRGLLETAAGQIPLAADRFFRGKTEEFTIGDPPGSPPPYYSGEHLVFSGRPPRVVGRIRVITTRGLGMIQQVIKGPDDEQVVFRR